MDVVSLISFSYEIGSALIKRCKDAKQCHGEATRIAVRTSRVLGSLESAAGEFSNQEWFETSMKELKKALEDAHDLVEKCKKPRTITERASAVRRANSLRDGLQRAEAELERITEDLKIPMQSDIKRAVADIGRNIEDMKAGLDAEALMRAVQEVIRQELNAPRGGLSTGDTIQSHLSKIAEAAALDDAPSAEQSKAGEGFNLIHKLGSVRYDMLEEDEDGILGEGTFGIVVSGTFKGEEVAIKKARGPVGDKNVLTTFRREAQIHFAMQHENIVRVLGFNVDDPQRPPCLIMELMDESLHQYIQTPAISPSLAERLDIISGVVKGLHFLHKRKIVHCDVKSLNVLLGSEGTAKLSDFGLAVVNASVARSTNAPAHQQGGSIPWMAPEAFNGAKSTFASDVFSVHVVMWEVLEHRTADSRPVAIGKEILMSGETQLFLDGADSTPILVQMQALLHQCGSLDHKQRPSMDDVAREVSQLVELTDIAGRPTAAGDRDVLTALLGTWGGLKPSKGGSWQPDKELSAWDGVSVDAEGRVTELVLGVCGLHGAIPPEIGRLAALKKLNLYDNKLDGAIPPEIGGLTALEVLSLGINKLTGVIPPVLGNLTALKTLRLEKNQLSGVIPPALGNLTALKTLRLARNQLSGVIPPALGNLTALKTLGLERNQLSGAILPEIGGLTALEWLGLGTNKLTGTIPPEIGGLTALEWLGLGKNKLTGVIPPALGNLTALKSLGLEMNQLSGAIPREIGGLAVLEELFLGANKLTGTKADVQRILPSTCDVYW
ncbi:unnamed protein product [Pylaiella littoralis]